MSRDSDVTKAEENAFVRFFERVNRQVEKAIGSPPISEDRSEEIPVALRLCPLCGHQMREHSIDESTPNVLVHCPVPDADRKPSPAHNEPLGELGMPASAHRLEKLAKRK